MTRRKTRSSRPAAPSARPARTRARGRRRRLNVLFTCVGRRVELLDCFRRAGRRLQLALTLHGADIDWTAPAMHHVDRPHLLPRIADADYIPALVGLAQRQRIDLVIPLIDSDLPALAAAAPRFAEVGTRVVISSEAVVRTCRDKLATFQMLSAAAIDTPDTWTLEATAAPARYEFPYYMKAREGSAGKGNYVIRSLDELRTFGARLPDPIVQEFVPGAEHTLDIYTGFDGRPRCVVPRRRLEVRTGEVSKGVIAKDLRIIAVGRRVVEALGECCGVVTVQCMLTPDGRIRVIEINPRFGGGVPLSIHAGADFPRWLMAEFLGRTVRIDPLGYRDHLAMLRYDQSVFVSSLDDRAP